MVREDAKGRGSLAQPASDRSICGRSGACRSWVLAGRPRDRRDHAAAPSRPSSASRRTSTRLPCSTPRRPSSSCASGRRRASSTSTTGGRRWSTGSRRRLARQACPCGAERGVSCATPGAGRGWSLSLQLGRGARGVPRASSWPRGPAAARSIVASDALRVVGQPRHPRPRRLPRRRARAAARPADDLRARRRPPALISPCTRASARVAPEGAALVSHDEVPSPPPSRPTRPATARSSRRGSITCSPAGATSFASAAGSPAWSPPTLLLPTAQPPGAHRGCAREPRVPDAPGVFVELGDWVGGDGMSSSDASLASAERAAAELGDAVAGRQGGQGRLEDGPPCSNRSRCPRARSSPPLFREHERYVWGLAYRMTGSAPDADDVVQKETFARAISRAPPPPPPRKHAAAVPG